MLWQKFLDICLCKNPLAKFWAAKLSCIFQTFLNSWAQVDFAENRTSSSLLNQLDVSWEEVLTPSDQMAANVQIHLFLAKISTLVHIAPIS